MRKLLFYTSILEISLGIFLLLFPSFTLNLLLGIDATKVTDAIGHLTGIVYICFGIACIPLKNIAIYNNHSAPVRGMFVYNLLAVIFLGYLKFAEGFDGILLLPAVVLHAFITVYFIFVMMKEKRS